MLGLEDAHHAMQSGFSGEVTFECSVPAHFPSLADLVVLDGGCEHAGKRDELSEHGGIGFHGALRRVVQIARCGGATLGSWQRPESLGDDPSVTFAFSGIVGPAPIQEARVASQPVCGLGDRAHSNSTRWVSKASG